MPYTHRNGETVPPTVAGWYWFEGRKYIHRKSFSRRTMLQVYDFGDGLRARFTGSSDFIASLTGRWWGPVTPPWSDESLN